ncbi:unnamed protein product [Brassica oleracea]
MLLKIFIMYPTQHRTYRVDINNLFGSFDWRNLNLRTNVLSIESKRSHPQEAGMNVFGSDKTGTLTLNKLCVYKSLIEVFPRNIDSGAVVLIAARASKFEKQDAIDASIVGMLGDPKKVI